ncbi:MAG: polysaccharide deacetylase family protein [Deltaproteobacteria bacterium]
MSSKKWLVWFAICIVLTAGSIAFLNWAVDPFGVFGDRILNWYSSDFTNNPRTAKITYMDQHHSEYDSYILGCSSTSSYPVESLNKYMNAKFYNAFVYGADTYDTLVTTRYILDHYKTKNLVINLSVTNAVTYDYEDDPLTGSLHAKVDGSSMTKFYLKYLFANTNYSINKLENYRKNSYLQEPFDVFNIKTGAYDKSLRDIEPISDMPDYLKKYPVFAAYPPGSLALKETDRTMACVAEIKKLCEQKHIRLIVIVSPLYGQHTTYFKSAEVNNFLVRLAGITDYWDFSLSSISEDPRYFYDGTHFRNCVGEMALARIFGDKSVYVPADFGVHVTRPQDIRLWNFTPSRQQDHTVQVPVLLYHHLTQDGTRISPEVFESHLRALQMAGYHTVSLQQLRDYVKTGAGLPDKPIVITFDDGYLSNYEFAYPLLKKYHMKATIFVIGASVGKVNYKDTDYPITPHFNYQQAQEMLDSGLIEIQSHSWDMHQRPDYEKGAARENALRLTGESEEHYIEAFRQDCQTIRENLESNTSSKIFAFAYPHGNYDNLASVLLSQAGISVTLTTEPGTNTVIKGLPQSLLGMHRYTVEDDMGADELMKMIRQ